MMTHPVDQTPSPKSNEVDDVLSAAFYSDPISFVTNVIGVGRSLKE